MDRNVTQGTSTKASDQNYSIKAAGDADYTITDGDKFDLVTVAPATARTITLPTLADNQARPITIFNLNGTDIVTVDGEGAETINGGTDETLVSINDFIIVIGTPATWAVVASKQSYDTGWINRSDWTNVHLGSNASKDTDSDVAHNLDAPLSDLLVKILISTDGSDGNSFELVDAVHNNTDIGIITYAVDGDNIKVQTGATGILYIIDDGTISLIDSEDWYYKIVVQRR